jgi:hypothetical protein
LYWREDHRDRRVLALFAVLMLHAVVGTLLVRSSIQSIGPRSDSGEFTITFLRDEPREPVELGAAAKPDANDRVPAKSLGIAPDIPKVDVGPQSPADAQTAVLLPPIDWTREAELAVRGSLDAAAREKSYRNLAGLSAAQLDWIRRNHMEPVDTNPPWAESAPRSHADGVVWISDDCALVNLLPVCRIKVGRKEARGDLFKNMRQHLDERETDPLP